MKVINCSLLLLFFCAFAYSQNSAVSSGGSFSNTKGSLSFSIGQVSYQNSSTDSATITEGVQQPYELFLVTSISSAEPSINLSVYPNPTARQLTIEYPRQTHTHPKITLYNLQGEKLMSYLMEEQSRTISLRDYPAGTYLLTIHNHHKMVATFRIVKQD